jgi:hypothetical protein
MPVNKAEIIRYQNTSFAEPENFLYLTKAMQTGSNILSGTITVPNVLLSIKIY